jgi:hypothetical protein
MPLLRKYVELNEFEASGISKSGSKGKVIDEEEVVTWLKG